MDSYTVQNLSDLFDTVITITRKFGDTRPWYRGHSMETWDLVPSIHRQKIGSREKNIAVMFRSMAKVRHERCPADDNIPAWLFLMQHYGLPTRILDWSESPLVSLFFAMENRDFDDHDGTLWALNPTGLNTHWFKQSAIPTADNSKLAALFREAFTAPDKPTTNIVAILPDHTDLRQLLQHSTCTIHGSDIPINQLEHCDEFIAKIIIPKSNKIRFRQTLDVLRISRSTLFPDLENLSKDLLQIKFS